MIAAIPGVDFVATHGGALWAEAPGIDVRIMAEAMAAQGLRLAAITAIPRSLSGETTIVYHFVGGAKVVNLRTETRGNALPSLAATCRAASWAEREAMDLFGVVFTGHPDPSPLLCPPGLPPGLMRAPMCGPGVRPAVAGAA